MTVVFDEVVGSVDKEEPRHEPSQAQAEQSSAPSAKQEHNMPMLRANLMHFRERAARLRAD